MIVRLDASALAEQIDQALDLGLAGEGRWFRADVCRGIELRAGQPSVDREHGIIYGYSVITQGPALGHNMEVDQKTLDQVVALGNQAALGIKSRFDHPNASNTSMGTFIGRTKNFQKVGDRVIGDLHLSESAKEAPQGDLYTYVLGLAERDPSAFGASIVFSGQSEYRLNEDGTRANGPDGAPLPALARVEELLASDVVDEPAANPGGLFSAGHSLASKITSFLNRWAEHDLLPRLQALTAAMKEDSMSTETVQTPITFAQADLDAATKAGEAAERARVTGIFAAQLPGQEALAQELIALGASVEEATKTFKLRKLSDLTQAAPTTAGGGSEDQRSTVDLSALPLEDRCKAEWEQNVGGVRDEFTGLPAYVAFARAEARGGVKILQKTKE